MTPLLRGSVIVVGLALTATTFIGEARAHGGTYRGPGTGLGPGGAAPSVPTGPATGMPGPGSAGPSTGGDASADLTGWQLWWGLNREPYLALRTQLAQGGSGARTGTDGTPTGPVGRPTDSQVRARIAPALLTALQREKNPDVTTGALLALAKCGQRLEPAAQAEASLAIQSRLGDANQEVAETAAIALGILARTADLSLLGDVLGDGTTGRAAIGRESVPVRTRAFAAYALGIAAQRIRNEDSRRWIAHRLVAALREPQGAARDVHVAVLVALGLVELRDSSSLQADGEAPPTASSRGLYDFVAAWYADVRNDEVVRAYAAVPMARLAARVGETSRVACILALTPALESGSRESAVVRQSAVQAMGLVADGDGDVHDVRARALLENASRDGDRLARRFAWIALARCSARPGSEGRDALLATRSHLLGLLTRGSTPERPWITLAIGVAERAAADAGLVTPPGVYAALEKAIRDRTSPTEAGAHMLGLALSGSPASGSILLERVATLGDDETRAHAALALGLSGTQAAVEPLRRLVLDSRYKPRVLREAAIALGLLGDRSLTPDLVTMLAESRGLAALSSVATALGFVGDERAVEPLLGIAADSGRDASARAFAFVALGLLGDPEPLPWNTPFALDANWWLPPATFFEPTTGTGVLDLL